MDKLQRAIGVFDSGIGGLSVLQALLERLPSERFIYLGDTARVPYGNKSPETIRCYAKECVQFLLQHEVKAVVVACNTVSATALEEVKSCSSLPVIDMILPAAEQALKLSKQDCIGVIATRATVASGAYEQYLRQRGAGRKLRIFSIACPLFVPLAEEAYGDSEAAQLIAEHYLKPLRQAEIDTLILACTHFPLLRKTIEKVLPGVQLIDCGEQAAQEAKKVLQQATLLGSETQCSSLPRIECYLTDELPTFGAIASKFLGFPLEKIHLAKLEAR